MRAFSLGAVVLSAVLLAACTTKPILNIQDAPVVSQAGKPLNADQVRAAIQRACAALGWTVKDAGPGKLNATIVLRSHSAEIEIPYSAATYSLIYKSSVDLRAANGQIHGNYNGWIQNLDKGIKAQMALL